MDFSAENGWRERLMRWLVQILHGMYRCAKYRHATAWDVTLEDLQQLPAASTGRAKVFPNDQTGGFLPYNRLCSLQIQPNNR